MTMLASMFDPVRAVANISNPDNNWITFADDNDNQFTMFTTKAVAVAFEKAFNEAIASAAATGPADEHN